MLRDWLFNGSTKNFFHQPEIQSFKPRYRRLAEVVSIEFSHRNSNVSLKTFAANEIAFFWRHDGGGGHSALTWVKPIFILFCLKSFANCSKSSSSDASSSFKRDLRIEREIISHESTRKTELLTYRFLFFVPSSYSVEWFGEKDWKKRNRSLRTKTKKSAQRPIGGDQNVRLARLK